MSIVAPAIAVPGVGGIAVAIGRCANPALARKIPLIKKPG
jgi:hypothetical protein